MIIFQRICWINDSDVKQEKKNEKVDLGYTREAVFFTCSPGCSQRFTASVQALSGSSHLVGHWLVYTFTIIESDIIFFSVKISGIVYLGRCFRFVAMLPIIQGTVLVLFCGNANVLLSGPLYAWEAPSSRHWLCILKRCSSNGHLPLFPQILIL